MSVSGARLVSLADVNAAAARIAEHVAATPMVTTPNGLRLKAESLQPCGAFKIRGAFNALLALPPHVRARGVVAPSSGNHAQAVAYAARRLGAPAVAVMPNTAPQAKQDGVRRWGGEVMLIDPIADGGTAPVARRLADARGLTVIHPFDTPEIIAATGTLGLEMLAQAPDAETLYIPVSGGGLIAGVAVAARATAPGVRIVGVEPALADDATRSFRARRLQRLPFARTVATMADGLRVESLGQLPWRHIRTLVDDMVTVSEAEIAAAVGWTAREARLVAEPSGAAAVAAALRDPRPGAAVALVSGGNIDPTRLSELLAA